MARSIPFSQARSKLTELFDEVQRQHEHVIVTRNGRPAAVLMSLQEYEAIQETLEVLADPQAMDDIRRSEADVRAGRVYNWDDLKRRLRRA